MKTITGSEWTWIIKQAEKCETEQRELISLINGRFPTDRMDTLIKILHSLELQRAHLEWIRQCSEI
jgi:hypothetical protein